MYYSYYLRIKPIGLKSSKSYDIVVTYKNLNKSISYKFIDKIGSVFNLRKNNSFRYDRIVLLDTDKLKYWFIKKIKITKSFIFHFFFCNNLLDQGNLSYYRLSNYILKKYGFSYLL